MSILDGARGGVRACTRCVKESRRNLASSSKVTLDTLDKSIIFDNSRPPSSTDVSSSRQGHLLQDPISRMERSPKRQCIITRQLSPSDYLIKLKPRSFTGRNYLVPVPNKGKGKGKDKDKGDSRSFYLKLHQEAISNLSQPGPHLGLLKPHGLELPSKLDEWVRLYLAQRILEDLDCLVSDLRRHTPKVKNLIKPAPNSDVEGAVVVSLLPNTTLRHKAVRERVVVQLPGPGSSSSTSSTEPWPSLKPKGEETGTRATEIDLSHFPISLWPGLYRHFADLLRTERTHTLRNAISRGDSLTNGTYSSLIGKPPSYITEDGSGLAGQKVVVSFSGEKGERGQLGAGVMISLLRWRLYSGDGWTSS